MSSWHGVELRTGDNFTGSGDFIIVTGGLHKKKSRPKLNRGCGNMQRDV
jgi:hypothetical protein